MAEWGKAPTADEVLTRDDVRMLEHPALEAGVGDEGVMVAALLERFGPEQVAAGFVRLWREGRSAPEELSDTAAPTGAAAVAPRERGEFGASVWYALSVGRAGRAEARWLLPKICDAGGITKDGIGAIRVQEDRTFVQIAADLAGKFGQGMELESGVMMERLAGEPDLDRPERSPRKEPVARPRAEAPRAEKPAYVPKPARVVEDAAVEAYQPVVVAAVERKPYVKPDAVERKPYAPREAAERAPYSPLDREKKPYAPKPFAPAGEKKPYAPKPYAKREASDRKPYAKREDGDKKPYVKRDDAKPYAPSADRKPYAPRDAKPYAPTGDKKPYAPKPYAKREDGDKRPYVKRDAPATDADRKPRWKPEASDARPRSAGFKSHGSEGKPARAAGFKSHATEGKSFGKPVVRAKPAAPRPDAKNTSQRFTPPRKPKV